MGRIDYLTGYLLLIPVMFKGFGFWFGYGFGFGLVVCSEPVLT